MTDTGDTRSLTYAEIDKARGISPASAKRLALRHGWRKVPGNDGLTRVSVPVTWLEVSPETPLAMSPVTDGAGVTGDMSPETVPAAWLIEARADAARKEGEVTGLREAMQRADAVAEQALGQVERERERADAADRAREAAEVSEAEAIALARKVIGQLEAALQEQAEAAVGEAVTTAGLEQAQQAVQKAAAEAAAARNATTRAGAQGAEEHAARKAAEVATQKAQGRADRVEGERDVARGAVAQVKAQAAAERAAHEAAERERAAALAELAEMTSGGPLRRAWRAFAWRRGRP